MDALWAEIEHGPLFLGHFLQTIAVGPYFRIVLQQEDHRHHRPRLGILNCCVADGDARMSISCVAQTFAMDAETIAGNGACCS